ncbi:hypothetical protein GV827_09315 [Sulfitobacter sp. JBTF-M27]|uniref:Uncharacterized protein n=1 Tax=Sulfitobacter sediminilitoris TaxID=2698830 RepID=A0A6P0C8V7_9RHOB|nr:hypothetical protein [Sulfitobacter sediminilitoris]NEK22602.1 hypothetical protein [Sulfitobacter sediminilitoris]
MFQNAQTISPLAAFLALGTSIYALLALALGWGLNVELLIRHPATQSAMVPATAAGFLVTGTAVIATGVGLSKLAHILTGIVLVIICMTALGQLYGWYRPAELFVTQLAGTEGMAPATEFGFILAVFALNRLIAGSIFIVEAISIFGLSSAIMIALLNLSGTTGEFGLGFLIGISLQTSILFALLFTALCLVSNTHKPD